MKKVMFVFGTRPEAIKLAPVILEMRRVREQNDLEIRIVFTGQHETMANDIFDTFDVYPHYRRNISVRGVSGRDLTVLLQRVLEQVGPMVRREKPDMIIVQGDTTTALGAALIANYNQISLAHVEAGLRTRDRLNPFPEEMNRVMIDYLSTLLFVPTRSAFDNLLLYGCSGLYEVGNTVVDALHYVLKTTSSPEGVKYLTPYVLITAHRRESFGEPLRNIAFAVCKLAQRFPKYTFIYPVHLNPQVKEAVSGILGNIPNVILANPYPYKDFVHLMANAELILSDSGGIQEEVPTLLVPLLILRDKTERPEILGNGGELVGRNTDNIYRRTAELLEDETTRKSMISTSNPFGDGKASERIVRQVVNFLGERRKGEKK